MKTIVLDTSLQGVTVGLVEIVDRKAKILNFYGSPLPQEAAAKLPEICSNLLQAEGLSVKDLDAFLVSRGPGSFTGIKIGLAFALGWQQAKTKVKFYGVSSFAGLQSFLTQNESLFLPATQTAGYFARKTLHGIAFGTVDLSLARPLRLLKTDGSIDSELAANALGEVKFLAPWPKVSQWLETEGVPQSSFAPENIHQAVILGMVEDFIANSDKLSEGILEPVYLRKSAPEEKLENSAKSLKQD